MNRKDLRTKLKESDGTKCHYCGIEEKDFPEVWGTFRHGRRGLTLEVDRKDNKKYHSMSNCVLACYACNNAKSDVFLHDEFNRVGAVIKEIWQQRIERKKRGQI
jgi:5-methylcytosine-specific restriction endonuclease McrA